MPSIADVVDLFETELAAIGTAGAVPVFLGEEFIQENNSPPQVVFVPAPDRFMPRRSRDRVKGRESIATRSVGLTVRIWAEGSQQGSRSYADVRATELLLDKVCVALRSVLEGNVDFEGGEWMPTSPAQLGRIYLLRIRVDIPVVLTDDDAPEATTTYTKVIEAAGDPVGSAAAITTDVEFPDGDVTGTPSP